MTDTNDSLNAYNSTEINDVVDDWLWDDATWIMCASFIIFTMQTGK